MISNIDLIQKYKDFLGRFDCEKNDTKMLFFGFLSIGLPIIIAPFIMAVLISLIAQKGTNSLNISFASAFFAWAISYFLYKKYKKKDERIEMIKNARNKVFIGDLEDIFDFSDKTTLTVFKIHKKYIEDSLFRDKGLHIPIIFTLLDFIRERKMKNKTIEDKTIARALKAEESKSILMENNTSVGKMLTQIRMIG